MNKLFVVALLLFSSAGFAQTITTRFEQSNGTETPTYFEIIDWWQKLDKRSDQVKVLTMGMTDSGFPLHLIVVSGDKDFNFESLRKKNKRFILINNGIHPGEPDGIDVSMLLVRDIVAGKEKLPNNIVLAIIPIYNIGGCLNRSANYRVDQNGPEEFGFRGNSQNLDLNRDFIKCDSKEAKVFTEIFHLIDPDVFVDNHVSDGADYQHVMTLIASQHYKLGGAMGEFMNKQFEPGLYSLMKKKGYDLVPYVNDFGDSPDRLGWSEFWDSPRYSSGYASLWHTFAFMPETHMLKAYEQRVRSTYALMQSFIEFTSKNSSSIKQLRDEAKKNVQTQIQFPVTWMLDKSRSSEIIYKGYAAGYKTSEVSGLPRLYYDRNKPFEKQISFYNFYNPQTNIEKPSAYVIPQGWWKVIDLLKLNKVQMMQLKKDTVIEAEVYRIDKYQSGQRPYEAHHPNTEVQVSASLQKINFRKGDYYIPMNQTANRFLMEVLEPQMEDSYFTWNFFDAILGQKEGFSDYVFEETAATFLKNNPDVKNQLEQRRKTDTVFAKSAAAQLNFVFQHSPYYEPDHLRYPVFRVLK
ncbi:MAG: M14 family metallopeptidase [Bacteroidota bacterium]|nr:M14 family metallopeptidase [Bacteroidota bacterium]